jgi:hypothetical protein
MGKLDWPWNRFSFISTHTKKRNNFQHYITHKHTQCKKQQLLEQPASQPAEHDEGLMWVQPVIYEPTTRRAHAFCAAMLLFSSSSCSSAL